MMQAPGVRNHVITLLAALLMPFNCSVAQASELNQPQWNPNGNPKAESQYAPERRVDITHLALDVTPDFEKRTVQGTATFTFTPLAKPLKELRLDGVDLKVQDVTCTSPVANYECTDKDITIAFVPAVPVGREAVLTIKYSAQPLSGLYFRVPSNGYKSEQMHLFTQGEMIEARHWFPCYDYPNEKFTSEITCRVPDGLTVISNGKRVSVTKDPQTNLVAFRWLQEKPHVNYLITLAAGKFAKLEDKYRDIPLEFYYLTPEKPQAERTFSGTKGMVEFFEKATGVEYPWAKYGQVVVKDFFPGGMENTSLTTLNEYLYQCAAEENTDVQGDFTAEEVVAHELAHQWWGDLVTCKDWSNSWLNEGFATYYATLYLGDKYGKDRLRYDLINSRMLIVDHKDEWRAIVNRKYDSPWEQFDHRAYQKAAWVVHMLHAELGEELFHKVVKTYLDRYQYRTVVTSDLESTIEQVTGRNFDRFFDQWLYKPGLPVLAVSYSWDEENKLAKISVKQKQTAVDEGAHHHGHEGESQSKNDALIYHFPLTARFRTKNGTVDKQLEVKQKEEDFYVSLPNSPETVEVDPDVELLAKIEYSPPTAMLYKQLLDKSNTASRVVAAGQLAEKTDDESVSKLKDALQKDSFYGVRIAAAGSLHKMHTDPALDALIASQKQDDARVRLAVVKYIGMYFHPKAREALVEALKTEENPRIIAQAVKGLGPYHQPAIHQLIEKYLNSDSYHNMIAAGALEAAYQQDDPSYIPTLMQLAKNKMDNFAPYLQRNVLETLAYSDRNEKNRDEVREFLCSFLTGKRETYKPTAIRALGVLEDPKAISILETLSTKTKDSGLQKDAESAIATLRWNNKPHDNLKDLRDEVLGLQNSNRELKNELEDLKRKVKALTPASRKEADAAGKGKHSNQGFQTVLPTVKAERIKAKRK